LIVDPPATGPSPETRRAPFEFATATLIYVSYNPPTPARDLADLQKRFAIGSVATLDVFPQTAEIEVAVHLFMRKREGRFLQGAG
jgi:tRNA/tmRNA/rRNA uracil-C5-methylase (TrmA/RlmC/RlmD family)